ncbi:MAG: TRAM domain-containing protein [Myxococcota bacterium]|nr:TRAM domain-containing protein [Myxococcota bacterium]
MKLKTQSTLSQSGDAVSRTSQGQVVFITGAAPDELVEVSITKSKKSFARAQTLNVIEASAERVSPRCDYFQRCGGCVTQHVSASAQLKSKEESFFQTLERIGKIERGTYQVEPSWSGSAYGYRNRARVALSKSGAIGFRSRASNEVLDIESCPVLTPLANQALSELRGLKLRTRSDQDIELIANSKSALIGLPKLFKKALQPKSENIRLTFTLSDSKLFADDDKGMLRLAPGVFSQSNREGNAALIDFVDQQILETAPLVELYAGSGNFTRFLLRRIPSITTIEGAGPAVKLAKMTLPEQVRILEGSVEKMLDVASHDHGPNIQILTDPPRTGMSPQVVEKLINLRPKSLVYVSCDPATFSRDASRLNSVLELTRVKLFDLYPQTGHSEVVGVFSGR